MVSSTASPGDRSWATATPIEAPLPATTPGPQPETASRAKGMRQEIKAEREIMGSSSISGDGVNREGIVART